MARKSEKLLIEEEKTSRALWSESISGAKAVGSVLAASPIYQAITALVLIELLQRIKLPSGEPLIGDYVANGMTTLVFAKGASETLGNIIELVNPFD